MKGMSDFKLLVCMGCWALLRCGVVELAVGLTCWAVGWRAVDAFFFVGEARWGMVFEGMSPGIGIRKRKPPVNLFFFGCPSISELSLGSGMSRAQVPWPQKWLSKRGPRDETSWISVRLGTLVGIPCCFEHKKRSALLRSTQFLYLSFVFLLSFLAVCFFDGTLLLVGFQGKHEGNDRFGFEGGSSWGLRFSDSAAFVSSDSLLV